MKAALLHGAQPFFLPTTIAMPRLLYSFHPTARLVFWLQILVAVQLLRAIPLAAAFLVLPWLGKETLRRGGRLVWRTRWVLLSLFAIFSWGVAGEPLWTGAFSPTQEGLREALIHLGRLLLVLMAVSAFLEWMSLADWLVATHGLLKPLHRLGLDAERGVVRLMLALRYAETLPRAGEWRHLLADVPEGGLSEVVTIAHRAMTWADFALVMGALATLVLLIFYTV